MNDLTYDSPPLVEVALSAQFAAPGLSIAHLGAFWWSQREAFPHVTSSQPIPAINEDYDSKGELWSPPTIQLGLSARPECRLQMVSEDSQWMCQIQLDRLVLNWRKRDVDYPRYSVVRDRFISAWESFCEFVKSARVVPPQLQEWELTYVNAVPRGELWSNPNEWSSILPGLWGSQFLSAKSAHLRGLRGQWAWGKEGVRMYVDVTSSRTEIPTLILQLATKGRAVDEPNKNYPASFGRLRPGLETAHKLIVETFDTISSVSAKKHWRRHDVA